MHIVHHVTSVGAAGGGMPRATLDLTRLLAGAGHRVTLLAADDEAAHEKNGGGARRAVERGGVEFVPLGRAPGKLHFMSRGPLARIARVLDDADVVHLHGLWQPRNYQVFKLASRRGLPFVVSAHGMLNDWALRHRRARKVLWYRLFEQRILAAARFVHVTAERERTDAAGRIDGERLRLIPLAPDLTPYAHSPPTGAFARAFPDVPDDPAILMIGRLHPVKRIEMLIDAVARLRNRGIRCQLLIAGSGERRYVDRLQGLARRLGVDDRTRFLGLVVGDAKLDLYRRARLVALPSLRENFALSLIESLASGTPVVMTGGVDTWEEMSRGGGACVVEADATALAEAIGSLLLDESRRAAMGTAGREWVFRWLATDTLIEEYVAMYRDSAGQPDGGC